MIVIPLRAREPNIVAGAGLLSSTIKMGKTVNTVIYAVSGDRYRGAWWCEGGSPGQLEVTMTRGFVNALEPVGPDGEVVSASKITGSIGTSGKAWICVRVQIDKTSGRMIAKTQAEVTSENLGIVIQDHPTKSASDEYGVTPLAFARQEGETVFMYQVAFFDYRHSASKSNGRWRHFFSVA